mgnify:CR=1 FL=1
MDKKRQLGIIGGTLGVIAVVLVVTVAWAAFLTNLTINGSATVAKSSWGVEFQNLQAAQAGNDDGVTHGVTLGATAPSITNNSTTIGNYSVTLSKPGDYVIYEFDIVNTGTFDAKIDTGFALPTPTCTKTGSGTDANATTVCGNLSYTFNAKSNGNSIILDTYKLYIKNIYNIEKQEKLNFSYGDTDENLGEPLNIYINYTKDATISINIEYETTDEGSSAQFLTKEQTFGKEHPYFFTQSALILGRSLFPCQDTPAVKFKFN